MFHHAHHFSIHGGQFIFNSGSSGLHEPPLSQNATITYEKIKFATPAAPTVFTGRDGLVAEAVQELSQTKQAHLAILGVGGIGKTALALYIMKHEAIRDKFRDRSYFVPCEICSDASSLLQGILQALKLIVTEGHDPYETLERYLELSQDPMLLVLDNFETPWNTSGNQIAVQNLIEWIWDQELVSIVLTMRAADGPGSRKWYKLGGHSGLPTLDLDAAKQAFMLLSNSQSENVAKLDWLLEEVDCMPLAILLIAQLKRQLSIDTLIKKWKQQKTRMLKSGAASSRHTSVAISIDISLQILQASSNEECIGILPILSFLPNGVPLWQETLKHLIVEPDIDLEVSVISLLESALAYQENECLKMLSPIREYLQSKYPTQEDHLNQMGKYYVKLLRDHSPGQGQDIIEIHSSNITKVLETLLQMSTRREYLDCLYDFAEYGKFSSISVELIDIALAQKWDESYEEEIKLRFEKERRLSWMGYQERAIAEIETIQARLKDGNIPQIEESRVTKIAMCLKCLGDIFRMQNNYPEAKLLLTEAKTQFEKAGEQFGAAQCIQRLGDIFIIQNNYPEAELLLTEAKTQFENAGKPLGAAQCIQRLGDICRMQNNYLKAKLLLTEAKSQYEKVGHQLGVAQCNQFLGDICRMQNNYPEAKFLLTEAKNQFEKLGYPLGAAQCTRRLGDICRMQSNYSEAKLLLTEAKTQFQKVGYQLGDAQCIRSLGDICKMQNNHSEAKLLVTEAKTQFQKVGHQLGVAQCNQFLGDSCRMQSNFFEAKLLLTEAKNQFQKLGYPLGDAQCIRSLGDICRMQSNYHEAKLLLTEAKTQFEQVGEQLGVAQCIQCLGDICRMQGEYPEAKLLLTEAKTQFDKVGHQLGAAQCAESLGDIFGRQGNSGDAQVAVVPNHNFNVGRLRKAIGSLGKATKRLMRPKRTSKMPSNSILNHS
ncbi:TPR-like protein [Gymnopus androsaceus JB14]|uniref:TPR-like protein n=1 Tax=Gymnopus androsaceus JB14 TaxID=1447944 RepID=A0A6A4HJ06_9AGAR|nr:TPR-like protein [Gymnopus androsaceus JB14]